MQQGKKEMKRKTHTVYIFDASDEPIKNWYEGISSQVW
jgi:hypothetical protein